MINGTLMQLFEWYLPCNCDHWKNCIFMAEDLENIGITAVWLPPAYKCAKGKDDVGYGVYDLYDLGEFDQKGSIPTKYGTKNEYLAAIAAFHKHNIHVYADIVLNHKMGADGTQKVLATSVSSQNREHENNDSHYIEAWTYFNFPGRNNTYSDFKWHCNHFDGIDWDEGADCNCIYLLDGKNWDDEVDKENVNYDYLMGADIDFSNEEVINELTTWGKWYITVTGIDGFRLDALKHIRGGFYKNWLNIMREFSKKEMFTVGEYWHGDKNALHNYLYEVDGNMSLMDVPLHYNLYEASQKQESYDLRRIFNNTLVLENPLKAVTFVDNHDTQPNQALASFIEPWFKQIAYSLILFRQGGYPCVFYGDYYGLSCHNKTPNLDNLIRARKNCAYGIQNDFFDDYNLIGFTREGDEEHKNSGIAVLISNLSDSIKYMYIGKHFAGRKFFDILDEKKPYVPINNDGWGCFHVSKKNVAIYCLEQS